MVFTGGKSVKNYKTLFIMFFKISLNEVNAFDIAVQICTAKVLRVANPSARPCIVALASSASNSNSIFISFIFPPNSNTHRDPGGCKYSIDLFLLVG